MRSERVRRVPTDSHATASLPPRRGANQRLRLIRKPQSLDSSYHAPWGPTPRVTADLRILVEMSMRWLRHSGEILHAEPPASEPKATTGWMAPKIASTFPSCTLDAGFYCGSRPA